jgi:O-antigen/teichoic acid export membrane protein
MSEMKKNVVANYLGKGWSILSVYIFIPFYMRLLGVEHYGIVAYYAVLFGVFALANMGLTATLSRELARLSAAGDSAPQMRDLVRTLEWVLWGIAAATAAAVYMLAPTIASSCLNVASVPTDSVVRGIRMMGFAMALRFPAELCHGGLLGLHRQVAANVILALVGTIRGGGSVLVLMWVSPTIEAFFVWQIVVNAFEAVLVSTVLWKRLPAASQPAQFRLVVLRSVWRYAAGMSGISVISILLTQVDKLTVGKILSLETFAFYSVASAISRGAVMIGGPIADAVFPKLTQLVQRGEQRQIASLYHQSCQLLAVAAVPVGAVISCFSYELLGIWTQDLIVAENSWMIATVLSAGCTCLALEQIPYRLAQAYGWTSLNVLLGVVSLVIVIPLTIIFTIAWGATGAALGWLVLNAGIMVPFILLLHQRVLPQATKSWFLEDLAFPTVAAVSVVLCGRGLLKNSLGQFEQLAFIGVVWLLATSAATLAAPATRALLVRAVRSRIGAGIVASESP